jgi:acyl carrier protein
MVTTWMTRCNKSQGGTEMTDQEKIAMLEETWELDEGTLTADTVLADVEEYDSMAKLSLIVLMDDEFGVKLTGDIIKGFVTVSDILKLMVEA